MADLPTNYLDDILAQSMNGKRKYRITRADGTFEEVTLEDVSEYEQVGSNFGAGDINKTNQAVNEKFDSGDVVDPMLTTEPGFAADAYKTKLQFDEQNKNLTASDDTKFRFATDGEGNYGYLKADDSFVPFSGNLIVEKKTINSAYTGSVPKTFTVKLENTFKKPPHIELLSVYATIGYEQVIHGGNGTSWASISNITNTSFDVTIGKWTNGGATYNVTYVAVGV